MFISKTHLSRRTFLQGAGATLALPFLESMIPAMTAQAATNSGTRLAFVYVPHGAIMDRWTPKTEGADFEFSFITKPLEPFRKYLTLISGMDMPEAMATTDEPGGDPGRTLHAVRDAGRSTLHRSFERGQGCAVTESPRPPVVRSRTAGAGSQRVHSSPRSPR